MSPLKIMILNAKVLCFYLKVKMQNALRWDRKIDDSSNVNISQIKQKFLEQLINALALFCTYLPN